MVCGISVGSGGLEEGFVISCVCVCVCEEGWFLIRYPEGLEFAI